MGNDKNWITSITDAKIGGKNILFFDMDGTLVDTDFANFLSYEKAIQTVLQYDTKISFSQNERFNRTSLKKIIPDLSEVEYEKIVLHKEENYKNYLPHTKLNCLVANILIQYSKTNKTILVTKCRKDRALMTLNYHKLTDKFSKLFFRENTSDKYHTNKFQNAISSLDISTQAIIIFENEEKEIQDAISVGILNENIIYIKS